MKAILFDVETTGLIEPQVIQSAWMYPLNDHSLTVNLWKPSKPIELGATATHHILASDLIDAPDSTEFRLPDGVEGIIGWNVDFDWKAIGSPDVARIDLMCICRETYVGLDSYSQTAAYYHLFGANEESRELVSGAHDAGNDVRNLHRMYLRICDDVGMNPTDFESVFLKSEDCRIPSSMPFGKHKGSPMADVPGDYRSWYLRHVDVDPYIAKAFRKYPCKF